LLICLDVDGSVALKHFKLGNRVKRWGVLDITGGDVEASCTLSISEQFSPWYKLTSVPWTR
jgi:hypothetical protein